MASQTDIEQAFRQSGIGRNPTSDELSFYSAYPDAGRVEGDIRAGGGGRSGFQSSGATTGASTAPQTDFTGIARQMLQLQQEANRPAVSSLQSQVPEIQAGFTQQKTQLEAKKEPLKARYDAILNQLKGKEQQEVTQTQTALGREYGRRGIPVSSGMFEQNLLEKTQPISQQYAGLTTEAGLGREEALQGIEGQISNLPFQEQEQVRAVMNAISQLQSGGNAQAIQNALSQFQFGQTQKTAQESAAAAAKAPTTLSEGQTIYDPTTGKAVYTAPKTYKPEEGGVTDPLVTFALEELRKRMGGTGTGETGNTEPKPTSPPTTPGVSGGIKRSFEYSA